jgi:hypothetical protein
MSSASMQSNRNLTKTEQHLSVAVGAALVCLGLFRMTRLRGLALAGLGAAMVHRGVTGHCHIYDILGIGTSQPLIDEGDLPPDDHVEEVHHLSVANQVDKDRFDKLKATQVERGRDELTAIEVAAEEVRELRRREGRSKDDGIESLADQFDQNQQ